LFGLEESGQKPAEVEGNARQPTFGIDRKVNIIITIVVVILKDL
jgi:hypothetical protein